MAALGRRSERTPATGRHARRRRWALIAGVLPAILIGGAAWLRGRHDAPVAAPLRSIPVSAQPAGSARPPPSTFEELLVRSIRERGYVSATIHVALADRDRRDLAPVAGRFGDGDDPLTNQYWGALYGLETYFANKPGWTRLYADAGDGLEVVRRVVFRARSEPSEAWATRSVDQPFDLYVLALAWRGSVMTAAMRQALVDALTDDPVTLEVAGKPVIFRGGSDIVGYVGQNPLLERRDRVFAGLAARGDRGPVGVFFACWKSAVHLHRDTVERGLYPMLFVHQQIVPEAYLIEGLLRALLSGELGDGLTAGAAVEYARYQKHVSVDHAAAMLFR